jgi:Skp family chaperone for outer membrane proteins
MGWGVMKMHSWMVQEPLPGGFIFVETGHRIIASIKADIAQLKTEHAEAKAERKAKLQARIDTLNAKLQEKLDKAKTRLEAIRHEADAKVEALKEKAAQSKQDIKVKQEQRMATVKKHYNEWLDRQERRAS